MIRLLLISLLLFSLYLGFSLMSGLDSKIYIELFDYKIETNLLASIIVFILLIVISFIILKFIFLIFDLPSIIKRKFHEKKIRRNLNSLINAASLTIIDNKQKANALLKKLDVGNEHKNIIHLIAAETEENFDKKIAYLRELINSKEYNYFASKELAKIFYNNNLFDQAETYASKAFYINDHDSEILEILLHSYAKLNEWKKFIFIISKLSRSDPKKLKSLSKDLAGYFLLAAKFSLEIGADNEAINYLESALELNPVNIEAIDLYISLNVNRHKKAENEDILKSAFAIKPSFELAELYIKTSNKSEEEIYNELAQIAEPSKYMGLFLAIATYLNLPNKLELIRNKNVLLIDHRQ